MRFEFGEWTPDLPPLRIQNGLLTAKNVFPVAGGYGPIGSLSNIDAFALSAAPKGSVRGQLPDGTNFFIAGTDSTLERRGVSGWNDVSRAAGYTSLGPKRWSMAQFGNDVFAVNAANQMQVMNVGTESTFSDVVGAPRAAHLTVAEQFLWTADIFTTDLGVVREGVQWSSINNGRYWPDPASNEATAALSGRQILEGNGGVVNGIVSGAEVVGIFQENAIWRADFVGNDVVWQFNRVETDHGLAIPGALLDVERGVLFIAEDGFRMFDYTNSQNIGKDRINDWFFSQYDADYPDAVTMTRDPQQTRVIISFPATGNSGVPNRWIIWDYVLDKWSYAEPGDHYDLIAVGAQAPTLDAPNTAADPDDLVFVDSFDDRILGAGRVELGAFDSSFQLSDLSGVNLAGVLETGDVELTPGRRSLLTSVRPQVDGAETSVQVASFPRRAEDTTEIDWSLPFLMDGDGECHMRIDNRFHRLRFNLSSYFTEATYYDTNFRKTGTR